MCQKRTKDSNLGKTDQEVENEARFAADILELPPPEYKEEKPWEHAPF